MSRESPKPVAIWSSSSIIYALATSFDGIRVASGSRDNTLRICDIRTGTLLAGPLYAHTDQVRAIAFSRDGERIVSGSDDKSLYVWDAESGAVLLGPLRAHTHVVLSVGFSSDGKKIVSGSYDQTICVWDAFTGELVLGPLEGHTSVVHSVAFSPDDTLFVSGSLDTTIQIWDARTGVPLAELKGHTDCIFSVCFSPDGKQLLSGSYDRTICIWDVCTRALVKGPLKGHTSAVSSVSFSSDGALFVSGSWDNTIRIWDARTGDSIGGPFVGHTCSVSSVAFCLDGTRIVSGSPDSTIRVWDVPGYRIEPGAASKPSSPVRHAQLVQSGPYTRQIIKPNKRRSALIKTKISRYSTRAIPTTRMISSKMSAYETYLILLLHGCNDFSSRLHPSQISPFPIASGGFGDIFHGRTWAGQCVAVKCLRSFGTSGKGIKRAARELYVWSKLSHPNVQPLDGVIMFQGRLGMVSPWMEYGHMKDYISNFPEVERYELVLGVARGVEYLHGFGMVHGDIKASNVLISRDGVARLSDFDHSILFESSLQFSATTNLGGGTLRWMAPELLISSAESDEDVSRGENDVRVTRTKETDVYALGMTILETITGKVPYEEHKSDWAIYRAIDRKRTPVRPDCFSVSGEDRTWAILLRCWQHEPGMRPDAEWVARSLQSLLAERS
ncbi:WD40 repeat-like protein [Ceratobasidium sp. AG-I]|nr:WD40 repeat-like protein [Ceratobasidium sp. AG-I]